MLDRPEKPGKWAPFRFASTWREYRYGTKPTTAKRKLKPERQLRLIEEVSAILKTAEPTHFSMEGACRQALRSALCLKGWCWTDADEVAEKVVRVALERIGAERPSWAQGQPGWTEPGALPIERTRCARCRKPLPDDRPKYCSDHCRKGAHDAIAIAQRCAERNAAKILQERMKVRK